MPVTNQADMVHRLGVGDGACRVITWDGGAVADGSHACHPPSGLYEMCRRLAVPGTRSRLTPCRSIVPPVSPVRRPRYPGRSDGTGDAYLVQQRFDLGDLAGRSPPAPCRSSPPAGVGALPSLVLAPGTVLPSSAIMIASASASPASTWQISQAPPAAAAAACSSRSTRRNVDADGGTRQPHQWFAHPAPEEPPGRIGRPVDDCGHRIDH